MNKQAAYKDQVRKFFSFFVIAIKLDNREVSSNVKQNQKPMRETCKSIEGTFKFELELELEFKGSRSCILAQIKRIK